MTDQIREQIVLFCVAIYTGAMMAVVYDSLRIIRNVKRPGEVWIWIQDILYWMCFAYVAYTMFLEYNYGGIRSYGFVGIIIGMTLYFITISKFLIKYVTMVLIKLIKILTKALKIVSKPIKLGVRCMKNTLSKVIIWLKKAIESKKLKKAQQSGESARESKQGEGTTTEV